MLVVFVISAVFVFFIQKFVKIAGFVGVGFDGAVKRDEAVFFYFDGVSAGADFDGGFGWEGATIDFDFSVGRSDKDFDCGGFVVVNNHFNSGVN